MDEYWTPKGGADWGPAELVKRLRLMRGLTQSALALRAGVAPARICEAKTGTDIRMSTLRRYVEALGCRLDLRVRAVVPFEVR